MVFLHHMDKALSSNLHAVELLEVQRRVKKIKCLKMGNFGIYNKKATSSQTYCNHAVYLTIKALDKKFTEFTDGYDKPCDSINDLRSDNNHKSDYEGSNALKLSNVWCDVLEYQANSNESTIKEIGPEEAQSLANMGYIVIVCWKNYTPGGSPHFATVAPDTKPYDFSNGPRIANVGGVNKISYVKYRETFGSKTPLRYYYNKKQVFQEDYSYIQKFED